MLYTIQNDSFEVSVSDKGAELMSIRDRDKVEYLWQGDGAYWSGRAYNVFPVCGRLFEGKYTYNGKQFEMGPHGFIRFSILSLYSKTDTSMEFVFRSNYSTFIFYPFNFEYFVKYTLSDNNLTITYTVRNTGENALPFSVGGHPGFNVPLDEGLDFTDYYIEFPESCAPKRVEHSERCFITGKEIDFPLEDGKRLRLKHSLFDNDSIFLNGMPKSVTLKSDSGSKKIKLSCEKMKYLGFWHTTKSDAPFLCIEPWQSIPSYDGVVDDIVKKKDMVTLSPGEEFTFDFTVTIN